MDERIDPHLAEQLRQLHKLLGTEKIKRFLDTLDAAPIPRRKPEYDLGQEEKDCNFCGCTGKLDHEFQCPHCEGRGYTYTGVANGEREERQKLEST